MKGAPMKLIFATLIFSSSLCFAEIGFKAGNTITWDNYQGTVTIRCNEGRGFSTNTYQCSGYVYSPGTHDYFVGPLGVKADEVELVSHRSDGKVITKDSDYDSKTFQSKSTFNLVISTLFQKPLLDDGENVITYRLFKSGMLMNQGEFIADLVHGKDYQCSPDFVFGNNEFDCNSQATACDLYFRQARCQ